jgi:hypothetical protein
MNCKITLTLLAAALCVGCASQPVVQSRGSLQEVLKQGTTYHLDAQGSGLGENDVSGLRERLRKAGLTPASAETAKLVVTLSSDLRSSTERGHTGGKNGVAYDRTVNERRLTLTVAERTPGEGQTRIERRHTGGKNGVAYDHRVNRRGVLLEVSSTDAGSTSAQTLLAAAIASLGG